MIDNNGKRSFVNYEQLLKLTDQLSEQVEVPVSRREVVIDGRKWIELRSDQAVILLPDNGRGDAL